MSARVVLAALLWIAACGDAAPDERTAQELVPHVDSAALARFEAEITAAPESARHVFAKYLPIVGPDALLDLLEGTRSGCHHESHELGQALYAATRNLETALRSCGTRCTSGCMHGVVAASLGSVSVDTITARMDAFCAEGAMAGLHKPGNCAHGVGHALMFATGGDVGASIDACLGFAREAMQYYCGTGVFMDRFMRDSAAWGGGTNLSPCSEERLFPGACYRYKGIEMAKAIGHDSAMTVCAGLEGLQRHGCYHGMGYASVVAVFEDPEDLGTLCAAEDPSDRIACIEGAVEKLADFHPGRAKGACAFLEGELREPCDRAAARGMYALDKPTFPLYFDAAALGRRHAAAARRNGGGSHGH